MSKPAFHFDPDEPYHIAPLPAATPLLRCRWMLRRLLTCDEFCLLDLDWGVLLRELHIDPERYRTQLRFLAPEDRVDAVVELLCEAEVDLARLIHTIDAIDASEQFCDGSEPQEPWRQTLYDATMSGNTSSLAVEEGYSGWARGLAEAFACTAVARIRLAEIRRDRELGVAVATLLALQHSESRTYNAIADVAGWETEGPRRGGEAVRLHGGRLLLDAVGMRSRWFEIVRLVTAACIAGRDPPASAPASPPGVAALASARLAEVRALVESTFAGLHGLVPARAHIERLAKLAVVRREHQRVSGEAGPKIELNIALVGPPGTCKTTFAERYAAMLYRAGLVRSDHFVAVGGRELIGRYIGSTRHEVAAAARRAVGGVLFIDEAYALVADSGKDYGGEAVVELMDQLKKHEHDLVLVFAGYEQPLLKMLNRNPGLRARVPTVLRFGLLSPAEAGAVLLDRARSDGVRVADDALDAWMSLALFVELPSDGRSVQQLYEALLGGPIADRALAEGGRLTLRASDLAGVGARRILRDDEDPRWLDAGCLDDEPS